MPQLLLVITLTAFGLSTNANEEFLASLRCSGGNYSGGYSCDVVE